MLSQKNNCIITTVRNYTHGKSHTQFFLNGGFDLDNFLTVSLLLEKLQLKEAKNRFLHFNCDKDNNVAKLGIVAFNRDFLLL